MYVLMFVVVVVGVKKKKKKYDWKGERPVSLLTLQCWSLHTCLTQLYGGIDMYNMYNLLHM